MLARHASGLSMLQVSRELFISERSVREVSRIVMRNLGASNLPQAILIAHKLGYLSDPDENGIVLARTPFAEST